MNPNRVYQAVLCYVYPTTFLKIFYATGGSRKSLATSSFMTFPILFLGSSFKEEYLLWAFPV